MQLPAIKLLRLGHFAIAAGKAAMANGTEEELPFLKGEMGVYQGEMGPDPLILAKPSCMRSFVRGLWEKCILQA